MATIKERVPAVAQDPIALVSISVMIIGMTIGYIFVTLGLSTMAGLVEPQHLGVVDGAIVTGVGLAAAAIGYVGWRGFMYFSY